MAQSKEYDLDAVWSEACASFSQATGHDLSNPSTETPQRMIDKIAAKKTKDDEKAKKYQTAKHRIQQFLTLIETFGGVAAQAASSAFPASSMCFNAVTCIISAIQGYSKALLCLEDLFGRMSHALERFTFYFDMYKKGDLDAPMTKICCDLVRCFIRICELSIKYFKKRVGVWARNFFFTEDGGVSEELDNLKKLFENEAQMKSTIVMQDIKELRRGHAESRREYAESTALIQEHTKDIPKISSTIEDMRREQKDDAARTKQLKQVEEVFGEWKPNDKQTLGRLRECAVEGTGTWLNNQANFQEWMDPQTTGAKILALLGEPGFGKSHLSAKIVSKLEQRRSDSNAKNLDRTLLAYIFFEPLDEKDRKPVAGALRSLVHQLCKDSVFLRDFSGYLGETKPDSWNLEQTKDIALKIFKSTRKPDTTCYIVLDGVDQVKNTSDEQHQILSQLISTLTHAEDSSCLRILLTGSEDCVRDLFHAPIPSKIDLVSNNWPDIRLFIGYRLNNMASFKTQSDSSNFQQLRDEVSKTLRDCAEGNFSYVDEVLEEIKKAERPTAIRKLLEEVKAQPSQGWITDRKVRHLEQVLSAEDIKDVNEILLWTVEGLGDCSIAELEAALYLSGNEPTMAGLTERIQSKFSSIFKISWDSEDTTSITAEEFPHKASVQMQFESYIEFFKNKSDEMAEESDSNTKLHKGEVNMVKRFLSQVCDDETYKKFGFDDFFRKKLTTQGRIGIPDQDRSSIELAKRYLRILRAPSNAHLDALRQRTFIWLPFQLQKISDPLNVTLTNQDKVEIAKQLVEILTSEEVIASWWTERDRDEAPITEMAEVLIFGYDDIHPTTDTIKRFLIDPIVQRSLVNELSELAKNLLCSDRPAIEVLEKVAVYMAKQWLQAEEMKTDVEAPILVVLLYIGKLAGKRLNDVGKPAAEDILKSKEWAIKQLGLRGLDGLGLYNLGRAFMYANQHREAISQYELASAAIEDDWFVQLRIAETYASDGEYPKAIDTLQPVLDKIKSGKAIRADPMKHITNLRRKLASYYTANEQYEKASELYETVQRENTLYSENLLDLIQAYAAAQQYSKTVAILNQYAREHDGGTELTRLTRIMLALESSSNFHSAIGKAAYQAEDSSVVRSGYNTVLGVVTEEVKSQKLVDDRTLQQFGNISYYYGQFLRTYSKIAGDDILGIEVWEECITLLRPHVRAEREPAMLATIMVAEELTPLYLEGARQGGEAADDAIEELVELGEWLETIWGEPPPFGDPRLPLARLFAHHDNLQAAKELLQSQIKSCFALLNDEDPTNDYDAFLVLGTILGAINDKVNALAAFSLVTPHYLETLKPEASVSTQDGLEADAAAGSPTVNENVADGMTETTTDIAGDGDNAEESSSDKSTTNRVEAAEDHGDDDNDGDNAASSNADDEGPLKFECDAPDCTARFTYLSNTIYCSDCANTGFCRQHYELLLAGEKYKACDKTHDLIVIPPYDPKAMEGIPRDHVKVGDEVVPILTWINKLRQEWGFPPQTILDKDKSNADEKPDSGNEESKEE